MPLEMKEPVLIKPLMVFATNVMLAGPFQMENALTAMIFLPDVTNALMEEPQLLPLVLLAELVIILHLVCAQLVILHAQVAMPLLAHVLMVIIQITQPQHLVILVTLEALKSVVLIRMLVLVAFPNMDLIRMEFAKLAIQILIVLLVKVLLNVKPVETGQVFTIMLLVLLVIQLVMEDVVQMDKENAMVMLLQNAQQSLD